jgi:hypothetical protein
MELTCPLKIRIGLAAAVGIALLGIFSWPMVTPEEPIPVVSVVSGAISGGDTTILIGLGFVCGIISYFLAWPYGRQIGILAAPAGLGYLAVKSCGMGTLFQENTFVVEREQILSKMCWEGLLWLSVVGAGFLGVYVASQVIQPLKAKDENKPVAIKNKAIKHDAAYFLNIMVAIAGSVIVGQFLIGIFARDFSISEAQAGHVIGQPATTQIVFALLMSFGITSFLVKTFLNYDYISIVISTALITPFAVMVYGRPNVISYFAGRWPAVFFPNSTLAILPIQTVAFGTIGAVAGYWIAVRYAYWQKTIT